MSPFCFDCVDALCAHSGGERFCYFIGRWVGAVTDVVDSRLPGKGYDQIGEVAGVEHGLVCLDAFDVAIDAPMYGVDATAYLACHACADKQG